MVLCCSALRLKDSGLVHLLCLLLLIVSSTLLVSAVGPQVHLNTIQENCLSGCNISTAEESAKTISSDVTNTQNQSSSPGFIAAPTSNLYSHNLSEKKEQANKSEVELQVQSNITQQMQSSQYTTSDPSHTTVSSIETASSLSTPEQVLTTSSATHHQLPTSHQPPTAAAQPDFTTMGLPNQLAHTGPSMSPAQSATVTSTRIFTTAGISTVINSPKSTSPTETTSTHTTTTEELPHPPTTLHSTANTTVTGTKTSPSLGAMSAMQTTPPNMATVYLRNSSFTSHRKSSSSATSVAMVEAAGHSLTRQLVDTGSLMAVLLFGLLFFLVTVAVFITQAYESYRRKDYTQVDYLINGMYIDSGV